KTNEVHHPTRHAIVIGAGIVGLSTAYHLIREGWQVTVIERDQPGQGCSSGNAGAVSPGSIVPLATPGILSQVPRMLIDRKGPLTVPVNYWIKAAPWLYRFVAASTRQRAGIISEHMSTLLVHALDQHTHMLADIGASRLLRVTGQIHAYPDADSLANDRYGWERRKAMGVEVVPLEFADLRELEPAIGPAYRCGYYLPEQGMMLDP